MALPAELGDESGTLLRVAGPVVASLVAVAVARTLAREQGLPVAALLPDAAAIAEAFDGVTSALGLADVLVNNAAGNFPVPAEDMSPNAWRTVTDIVLNGTFYCSREFGRRHIEAGTPGSIINIGAAYAWTGGPGFAHSSAAKAGVKNMTETLAVEWGPYGIQVNGISPLSATPALVRAFEANPTLKEQLEALTPLGRVGDPETDIGAAAALLLSPGSRYVTGQTLVVDGGRFLGL